MKSCILIGHGPGMGAALARAFGREGFALALVARSRDALAAGERELAARGIQARGFAADAGDEHALQQAMRHAEAELGPAGVLLYNAASAGPGGAMGLHRDALLDSFRTNVAGALTAAQQVAHGMRARGHGTILLTGGGFALNPSAAHAALSVGKAGLRALALALAEELAPDGIHAATVTIRGGVKPGTALDPDRIAAVFLELHRQPRAEWQAERMIP